MTTDWWAILAAVACTVCGYTAAIMRRPAQRPVSFGRADVKCEACQRMLTSGYLYVEMNGFVDIHMTALPHRCTAGARHAK